MELRGCSQLHFIQAIKGGLVTRVLNINSQGKPALMFKKVEAIYESEDSRNLGSCSTVQSQEGGGCHVERSCLSVGGRRTIKKDPGTCELYYDGGDNKRNIDFKFGEMTLKQLMERCKTKKRKLSESVDLTNKDTETPSPLKQDYDNLEPKEEEFDLEEPLSSLKLKLSNKTKAKRKCIQKHACSPSKTKFSVVKTEQIQSAPQDSLQTNGDLAGPINIKVEVSEPHSSNCENVGCFADVSTSDCHEKMDFSADLSDELPKENNGSELETGELISLAKESPSCVLNEISYEYLEHVEPTSLLPVSATVWGTMNVSSPEKTGHDSLLIPPSELRKEVNIACPLPCDSPPEAVSLTMTLGSEMYGSCERHSFSEEEISCQMDNNSGIQLPDLVIDGSLQCTELNNGGDGCMFEDDSKEDPPDLEANAIINSVTLQNSSQSSHRCEDPNSGFGSMDDGSTTTDEKHSLLTTERTVSDNANGARDCSAGNHSSDATDETTAMEVLENHDRLTLEHPPKRLFSTRKDISPTSQEKLRQAVDAIHDNTEYYKRDYASANGLRVRLSLTGSGLKGAQVTVGPKWIIKKPNNINNGSMQFVPRGILKGPQVSCAIPRAGSDCTSIKSCSRKAIAFSQRQMHDIECLAMKLTKELKSMKDIVEETLHLEALPSTSSKYAAVKIKTAIESAVEVEETTRKWLSMMARDCNRFCKIMRSTEKKGGVAAASGNGVHKERKKITFADEAGGMLCHVKVFEDPDPLLGTKCEKPETQAN
ncbi:hypothetical protein HHK36_008497 [Tetracentron sinense]|uniref:Uncharacterized protein n=1 Tax=Tetracentron sinense TaxID=13715 RepID=A0A834ZIK2_TETSI|nr:hypothetical protein HHK36_008497 [Tetracentron sinense]